MRREVGIVYREGMEGDGRMPGGGGMAPVRGATTNHEGSRPSHQLVVAPLAGAMRFAFLLFILLITACSSGGGDAAPIAKSPTRADTPTATASTPTPTPSPTTASDSPIAWLAFDGGGSRSGINTAETMLTPSNIVGLTRLWQQTLLW